MKFSQSLLDKADSVSILQIYWLAGLIEGEGCFSYGNHQATVRVSTTDHDTALRLQSISGLGRVASLPQRPNCKPAWLWRVTRSSEAVGLMMTIYPLLSRRRQNKIREILSQWRAVTFGPEQRSARARHASRVRWSRRAA